MPDFRTSLAAERTPDLRLPVRRIVKDFYMCDRVMVDRFATAPKIEVRYQRRQVGHAVLAPTKEGGATPIQRGFLRKGSNRKMRLAS